MATWRYLPSLKAQFPFSKLSSENYGFTFIGFDALEKLNYALVIPKNPKKFKTPII